MKNTILFFFLLLAAAVSAQSNSFVTDRLRAAEYLRIGTNTSQKITGFDRVITAPGTHDSLPTSRAVVDFLEANFTPIGYYTAGTGISISDDVITNAAPDQVVGLTGGGITVITGTYPNFTITSNEVDGSTTNELQNLSLSGQSLSISSGTGVTLPVVGVTAGTGIGVSASSGNYTVSNTGDLSATNEIQTLSLDGSDLSLSLGGGTVTLPGGASDALGTGFTGGGGSGTIPAGTEITTLGDLPINNNGAAAIRIGDVYSAGLGLGMEITDTRFAFGNLFGAGSYSIVSSFDGAPEDYFMSITANNDEFRMGAGGAVYYDFGDGMGVQYADEYPDILTNDRSLPDVGLIKQLIAGNWPLLAPDGSDTAPSYSFENATASGLYKASKGIELIGGGGNSISIRTQNETTESSQNISINTGSSEDGETGSFLIFSGESINGTGGGFSLQAGGGGLQGGGFSLSAGNSSAGAGGEFSMIAGSSAVGNGGRFLMNAGNSGDSVGGDIVMTPGAGATSNGKVVCSGGDGFVFPSLSGAQISALVSPVAGQSVFCTDCTANDSTTGVLQIWNGLKWKNCW